MSGRTDLTPARPEITLEVWSDYVCPYCYLAYLTLAKLDDSVTVTWHAFELRPPGSPPTPPEVRERVERLRPQFRRTAKEQHGLTINSGPFGVPSRAAHVGAAFAGTKGKKEVYSKRVYEAYWLEAKDISSKEVLASIAEEVGLDKAAFLAALENEGLEQQVLSEEAQARRLGLSGVPAAVVDRRYLVSGAQPLEVFRNAIDRARAASGPSRAAETGTAKTSSAETGC